MDIEFLNDDKIKIGKQVYSGDISLSSIIDGKEYSRKEKIYPGGYFKYVFSNKEVFKVSNSDRVKIINEIDEIKISEELEIECDHEEHSSDNIRDRSKEVIHRIESKIQDILILNPDLNIFLTITFDDNKINSTNADLVLKKISKWLNNKNQRKGLKYLLVPEYHPKSNQHRIHIHGCINDVLKRVDSNTRLVAGYKKPVKIRKIKKLKLDNLIKGIVYNVPEWKYGFSTAIETYGSRLAVAHYVSKYIGKAINAEGMIFGRGYLSSKNLDRLPEIRLIDDKYVSYNSSNLKEYKNGGMSFKYENRLSDCKYDDNEVNQLYEAVFGSISDKSKNEKFNEIKNKKLNDQISSYKDYLNEYEKKQKKEKQKIDINEKIKQEKRKNEQLKQMIKEEEERRQVKIDSI